MAGIIPPGGGGGSSSGPANDPQVYFTNQVAAQTGLDPRVVYIWTLAEGANAPGGTGGYNFLNLRPYPGDPYSSVSSGGFEQFSSVDNAVAATVRRIKQPFASSILQSANGRPIDQINAIAQSQWDGNGHYRDKSGTVGGSLISLFATRYGQGALGGAASKEPLPAAGGGASGSQTALPNPLSGISGFLDTITSGAFWLRALEVVGGVLLAVLGLYLLTKQVGLGGFDVPDQLSPAARQAQAAAAAVQAEKAQRQTEIHEARISESQARVRTQQARATELRTRVKHRRRVKAEQNKEVERAYIRGVAERAPLA